MAEHTDPLPPLSWEEKSILNLLRYDLTYRQIGKLLRIKTAGAYRRGTAARAHFAALHGIPLDTLSLDTYARNPERGPRLRDAERERLHHYFAQEVENLRVSHEVPDWLVHATRGAFPQPGIPPEELADEGKAQPQVPKTRTYASSGLIPPVP